MTLHRALAPHATPLALALGAAAGAAGYLGWPYEPWAYAGVGMMALGWLLAVAWHKPVGYGVWACGVLVALAQFQVMRAGEGLNWEQLASKSHWVTGRVAAVEEGASPSRRMVEIADAVMVGLPHGATLALPRVRVGLYATQTAGMMLGQGVALPLKVYPPEGPRFDGEHDYRLNRFLNHSTVQGFAMGKPEATVPPPIPTGWRVRLNTVLDGWRAKVREATLPYANGVLTSLLVAEQRQIPQSVQNAYRAAGLSHLLAVSGLQLTLVGGGVFWLVRWLVALWPALALQVNGRAIGAVVGLVAATLYAVVAGAPVSVQRALLMVALLLLAAVLGRLRSLPRAWAVAMVAVLVANPAAVMGAGFQLSFAAVGGLILLGLAVGHPEGWVERARWLARSSLVAAWATAPLLILNFGQFNLLGVVANMVAIPAMGPLTLLAFAGMALVPVGLHGPVFAAAGYGVAWVNAWAGWVSTLPLATVQVPVAMWPWVLMASAIGLALVLGRRAWGSVMSLVLFAVLGVGVWAVGQRQGVEVRLMDGGRTATLLTPATTTILWGENPRLMGTLVRYGYASPTVITTLCDTLPCRLETPVGAVMRTSVPTPEDCALNTVLVVPERTPPTACPARTVEEGGFAFASLNSQGLTIHHLICTRPWHRVVEACWGEPPLPNPETRPTSGE
ncbi:MAG: ComEC/Rec2 family competence protein [Alphaproteobacteria bacterium]